MADPIFAVPSVQLLLGTLSMKDLLFIDILIMVIQWDYYIQCNMDIYMVFTKEL